MFKRALLLAMAAVPAAASPPPVTRNQVVARAEKMFVVADRNHDGWLDRTEYRAAVLATARRYDPKVPADGKGMALATARFDALAAGTGGRLSEQAFVAEATGHFDGADLNHDGKVDPDESRRAAALKAKAVTPPAR